MSRRRITVGSDERGRPVSRWEDTDDQPSGYGFMEPAYSTAVERRQATPEELAAARARETPPPVTQTYAGPTVVRRPEGWTPHDVAALRERTGAVTGEDVLHAMAEAGGSPAREEEPAMDEDSGQTQVSEDPVGPLGQLAAKAFAAEESRLRFEAAREAWDVARTALLDAMADCMEIVNPDPSPAAGVTEPDVPERPDHQPAALEAVSEPASLSVVPPDEATDIPRIIPEPSRIRRSRTGEGQRAGQASARDVRADRVMTAMRESGDDMDVVASVLGMKKNAVAQVVKHARLRAGVGASA